MVAHRQPEFKQLIAIYQGSNADSTRLFIIIASINLIKVPYSSMRRGFRSKSNCTLDTWMKMATG
ncbi:hypothetical protein [Gilliamella sp. B3464]|uniref:hypothetical protein n=1 Tax=Gilliamella sp. B3464 TaxID=2818022 RepID=UPI0022698B83|nr:hypothetical protein [Gilliamella sp. B3464]